MADDGDRNEVNWVAEYKRILLRVLDLRPSGMRQRLADALGANRSFVSQITNPAYSIPIPARHLETIFRICHFSPEERKSFLAAYAAAHPSQHADAKPVPRRTGRKRTIEVELPATGDPVFDAAVEDIIRQFSKQVVRLARRS